MEIKIELKFKSLRFLYRHDWFYAHYSYPSQILSALMGIFISIY